MTRRQWVAAAAKIIAVVGSGLLCPARAATKIRFLTNWFADAEHGGFYQAKATGIYERAGLDVDIQMGGSQINGVQLLTGGDSDIVSSYDIQVLSGVEKGLPLVAICAVNQFDLQGIMAHADVPSLAALKGHKILIASTAYATFWPWLKQKFGFTDDQAGPYTFDLQPFFVNPALAQQAYVTSEPFEAQKRNVKTKFFLFADDGYPPYSTTLVTTPSYLRENGPALASFVRATMEGWKDYLRHPAPGNALIKRANPNQGDDQIAYSIGRFRAIKCVTGGDAATHGIGTMTETRWKRTRDFMVGSGMLKSVTDWKQAFTLEFVKDLHVTA